MIQLVDLEMTNHPDLGPEEKREELAVGTFARVLVYDGPLGESRTKHRQHGLWLKIMELHVYDGDVRYHGELVSDTHLDLDIGHEMTFGPENVLEWSTHY